jgi:hypothetical protein
MDYQVSGRGEQVRRAGQIGNSDEAEAAASPNKASGPHQSQLRYERPSYLLRGMARFTRLQIRKGQLNLKNGLPAERKRNSATFAIIVLGKLNEMPIGLKDRMYQDELLSTSVASCTLVRVNFLRWNLEHIADCSVRLRTTWSLHF